ncbi:probable G-protein coupled receptor Mth-like 14 isoform X1 [Lucilia sericata]|uniref:probable G-protein coupled receptor Mth-like 14 isoform X1 n=1 Tax=Lucilia sericata TaxID=13632 RepID=UPI0018A814D2|nr:probable G-protein coupled receptor Mth-like 14 isoform X1 [Lucilia sericata]
MTIFKVTSMFSVIISMNLMILSCNGDQFVVDNITSTNNPESTTINFNENLEKEYTETTTPVLELDNFPKDCSQRQKRKNIYRHKNSRLKKCCPIGESLSMSEENQSGAMCGSANLQFTPNLINVTLFDNCIEDMETEYTLPLEIGNPCNTSILYNDVDDLFFVIQDGSLLVMDLYANDSYELYNNYCIDINNISGITFAIVCITSVAEHISRSQIVVVAILMLLSIPCLLLVAYLHLRIKELRSLHGIILSCMSSSLATGYFLYFLVHIFNLDERNVGYVVQFFLLSYYFWFFSLCCNVSLNIWIHIPLNKKKSKFTTSLYFGFYCMMSLIGAVILVILTIQKGLPGMPSYFIQGYTESIRESQRYFIPPVSTLLLFSFIVMTSAFFGFQKLKSQGVIVNSNDEEINSPSYDENIFEEVKKDAKCISLLGIILISTWLLEIVTFYSPGPQIYLILMDMINGLQGVFVLLIFLVIRRRRTIIFRWWNDRGSHTIEKIELNSI